LQQPAWSESRRDAIEFKEMLGSKLSQNEKATKAKQKMKK